MPSSLEDRTAGRGEPNLSQLAKAHFARTTPAPRLQPCSGEHLHDSAWCLDPGFWIKNLQMANGQRIWPNIKVGIHVRWENQETARMNKCVTQGSPRSPCSRPLFQCWDFRHELPYLVYVKGFGRICFTACALNIVTPNARRDILNLCLEYCE